MVRGSSPKTGKRELEPGWSARSLGAIDLQSGAGDIIVHLPRELAVTIDARVVGGDHQLIVDPAFPLKVSYDDSAKHTHAVRAEGSLNGGGQLLRLRTMAGNIQLVLSDDSKQEQLYRQQMERFEVGNIRVPSPVETPGAAGGDSIGGERPNVARVF